MSSFWGLKLEGNLQYSKACVSDPFRITAASLDADSVSAETIVSVCFKGEDDQEFIIANLSKRQNSLHVPLHLRFCPGDKISFYLKGLNGQAGSVHLTGFNVVESYEPLYDDSEDESILEDDNTSFVGAKRKRFAEENAVTPSDSAKKSKRIKVDGKSEFKKDIPVVSESKTGKDNKTPKKLNKSVSSEKEGSNKSDSPAKSTQSAKKKKKSLKLNESSDFNITDLVSTDRDIDSDDESDEDFMMDGIQVEENGEEEDSSGWEDEELGEEEESGYLKDEDDDSDDEDESDDEDDESDDEDDDDDETQSPPKKKTPTTPSTAGQTPMTKKQKKQQDTPMPSSNGLNQSKSKTPKSDGGKIASQTPKSAKKNKENKENESDVNGKQNKTPQPKSPKQIKAGGLICEDLKVGTGNEAKTGKMIGVYYVGKLKAGGKTFDKHLAGTPFKFRLGSNEVIQAWDMGVQGMKVGGKRRVTCPPAMAYGKKGMPPEIPPNSVLVFDIELKNVN